MGIRTKRLVRSPSLPEGGKGERAERPGLRVPVNLCLAVGGRGERLCNRSVGCRGGMQAPN